MKIGITHAKDKIPVNYIRAVQGIDARPVLISTNDDLRYFGDLQGLLFSGGGDVAAHRFGQNPHSLSQPPDEERDELEYTLVELAQKNSLPILGICRGLQVVSCALGGTLFQHLPDAHLHSAPEQDLWHTIEIVPASALFSLYGASANVNSSHHQGADKIPSMLQPSACCGGVVEALEGSHILLVQFHPERMGETGAPVFEWLRQQLTEQR